MVNQDCPGLHILGASVLAFVITAEGAAEALLKAQWPQWGLGDISPSFSSFVLCLRPLGFRAKVSHGLSTVPKGPHGLMTAVII